MIRSGSPSSGSDSVPVALVIPVKDEARALPELFDALAQAAVWPAEIAFVDAGSTDGTQALLRAWWATGARAGTQFQLIELPGALPGGGRNAGVAATSAGWVAFLDGGIRPAPDWLAALYACARTGGRDHAFGLCHFSAGSAVPLAVCALTNGVGRAQTVLPASIFARSVFARIGGFPEHLRSAEDLLWLARFGAVYGARLVCAGAQVHYTHYPDSFAAIWRKWRAFERSSVAAGVGGPMRAAYLAGALAALLLAWFAPAAAGAALLAYLLLRGVADPVRRSRSLRWWRAAPAALWRAPLCALCIDGGKLAGALAGLAGPLATRWQRRRAGGNGVAAGTDVAGGTSGAGTRKGER